MCSNDQTIIYDFETTGLNPFHDNIIEFAFSNINTKITISGLVNPGYLISNEIIKITKITNKMLQSASNMSAYLPSIIDFISPKKDETIYIVAHNADGFDRHFTNRLLISANISPASLKLHNIDTLLLAKKLLPNLKRFNLGVIANYFKIKAGNHRADGDVFTLERVYERLLLILAPKLDIDVTELLMSPKIVYDYIYN